MLIIVSLLLRLIRYSQSFQGFVVLIFKHKMETPFLHSLHQDTFCKSLISHLRFPVLALDR